MTDDRTQADIDEVRRDRIVWTTLIILGVLVAAGALALGWRVVEGRLEAAKRLDRAMTLLEGRPTRPSPPSTRSSAPTSSPATAAEARAVAAAYAATLASSSPRHAALAGAGIERLTDDEQEQAHLVQAAATARIELLDTAPGVLSATEKARRRRALAEQAWAKTLAADRLARQSVTDYNKLKRADVKSAVGSQRRRQSGIHRGARAPQSGSLDVPRGQTRRVRRPTSTAVSRSSRSRRRPTTRGFPARSRRRTSSSRRITRRTRSSPQGAKQLPGSPVSAVAEAYKALSEVAEQRVLQGATEGRRGGQRSADAVGSDERRPPRGAGAGTRGER